MKREIKTISKTAYVIIGHGLPQLRKINRDGSEEYSNFSWNDESRKKAAKYVGLTKTETAKFIKL